jgi:hypothetical protein
LTNHQEALARERQFWDEQGWDHAYIGHDLAIGPSPSEIVVWIFDAEGSMLWSGTHAEFVEMSERRKAARFLDAARDIARGG